VCPCRLDVRLAGRRELHAVEVSTGGDRGVGLDVIDVHLDVVMGKAQTAVLNESVIPPSLPPMLKSTPSELLSASTSAVMEYGRLRIVGAAPAGIAWVPG